MSLDRPDDRDVVAQIPDTFVRRASLFALHVKRYRAFYAVGLVWLVALAAVPIIRDDGNDAEQAASVETSGGNDTASDMAVDPGSPAAPEPGADLVEAPTGALGAGSGSGPGARRVTRTAAQSLAAARTVGGKTRGGIDCKPGIRQIPISRYAAQCTAAWTGGDNGGATYRGVTDKEIRVVRRVFPDSANSRAVDAVVEAAGGASDDTNKQIRDEVWIPYFNKMFELYGRKITWVEYESENGNSTEEAQSRGREGACADATKIEKELKAFLVIGSIGSAMAECTAERKMLAFGAAAYYPEAFYDKYHPYLWGGVMECERISYQLSEYIGKRLIGKNAQWAGDPLLKETKRKFGTYVPDNDGYQSCVKIAEKELAEKYGGEKNPQRYNYQLDVSRFPDQASQGIIQFKAAGVTSIVTACDPISIIFMTQAAKNQRYYPEWIGIGTALQDTDNAARLYEQEVVNGHLFGMSQLGATKKILGPNSEAGQMYKHITGKEIPPGATGDYYGVLGIYTALQATGPALTPQNVATALFTSPPGGAPDFPVGYTSYQDGPDGTPGATDHTAVDDAREVYWVSEPGTGTAVGNKPRNPYYAGPADGNNGTYKETYGGKRFRNGQWPEENPPIYLDVPK